MFIYLESYSFPVIHWKSFIYVVLSTGNNKKNCVINTVGTLCLSVVAACWPLSLFVGMKIYSNKQNRLCSWRWQWRKTKRNNYYYELWSKTTTVCTFMCSNEPQKKNKPTRMKSEEWFSVKLFSMWFLGWNMAFHSFSGDKFKHHHLNANWIDGRFIEYAIDQFKLLAGVSTMYITCAVFKAWNSFTSEQTEIGHFKNEY